MFTKADDIQAWNLCNLSGKFLQFCLDVIIAHQHISLESRPINCASFRPVCLQFNTPLSVFTCFIRISRSTLVCFILTLCLTFIWLIRHIPYSIIFNQNTLAHFWKSYILYYNTLCRCILLVPKIGFDLVIIALPRFNEL